MVVFEAPNGQGEVPAVDLVGPIAESLASGFRAAAQEYTIATSELAVEDDVLVFNAKAVENVRPTETPGQLRVTFNEVVHGKHNTEVAVTAVTVSFGVLAGCRAAIRHHKKQQSNNIPAKFNNPQVKR